MFRKVITNLQTICIVRTLHVHLPLGKAVELVSTNPN
jgi:hypothetical protein